MLDLISLWGKTTPPLPNSGVPSDDIARYASMLLMRTPHLTEQQESLTLDSTIHPGPIATLGY
jgi:hypothetical protein